MVGLVVVSHSAKAAEGIVEVAAEMGGDTAIEAAGGDDGEIGTDADRISDGLAAADDGDGVVVLVDLGSAVMNAEVAIEMHDGQAIIADAPVLEGAVNAAVAATDPKASLDSVVEQAEAAADISKV
ncbi:PTS mannose transporter subunit IID [Halonotius terrestris]|uniref:phosphoenolpyruvate--glycerone phosphotransferase n=1 Tax=Halonotius terrestris TaxID=2487750 RepID=A0A8J8PC54_9EURY|nr:dihydroxyacetone kinase phosphoryl donor subunit DhaM [Halonotius terrestris]TQQ83823.1 PTS mannose transporter subunit IID [Halonotius terrestris]